MYASYVGIRGTGLSKSKLVLCLFGLVYIPITSATLENLAPTFTKKVLLAIYFESSSSSLIYSQQSFVVKCIASLSSFIIIYLYLSFENPKCLITKSPLYFVPISTFTLDLLNI